MADWTSGWRGDQYPATQDYWSNLGFNGQTQIFNGEENLTNTQGIDDFLSRMGYTRAEAPGGGGAQRVLLDANGNVVPGSQYFMDYGDDQFEVAAAAGFGGMLAAGIGAGAGLGAAGEAGGAGAGVGATGATSYPVSASAGTIYNTPLEIGAGTGGASAGAGAGAGIGSAALPPVTTATATPVSQIAGGLGTTGGPAGVGTGSFASNLLTQMAGAGAGSNSLLGYGQLLSSLYGIYQGNRMMDKANTADPFGPYRQQYASQIADLKNNPSMVTQLPGYEANMKAGELALTRNLAAQGLTGSGTAAQSLVDYGTRYQAQAYNNELDRLMQLAGAGSSGVNGDLAGTAAAYSAINQSLNNLLKVWGTYRG